MWSAEATMKMAHRFLLSFTVRWLLTLSCVTCAVIDRNEAVDTPPYMVYTSGPMIYRVNLDGSQAATLLDSSSQDRPNVLGIDFDYRRGKLFWVDSTQLKIMKSNLDGSEVSTVISSGFRTLERLAYDWVTQKIYWSDYGAAEIGIVDLETGTRTVLIVTGEQQLSRPRALVVDPTTRNMYWADWLENGAASIETASMDGRSRQVLVNSDINRPYGLTIDIASQTLYFIDGYYDNIERVNVDGSGRERLLHFRTDIVPYSLVYHNAALYWTERLDRVISMLTLQGETRVLSNVSLTNVRPAGLTLIAAERQPEVANPCSNSQCSDICLLSSADWRNYSCTCEEGVELHADGATCLVPEITSSPSPSPSVTDVSPTTVILLPSSPSPSPDVCTSLMPCKNGGVCKSLSGAQRYVCLCSSNYTGEHCETHINNVCDLAQPCKNGATCRNIGVYEYECLCPLGYGGRYCGMRINYGLCNVTMPCQNNGVCTNLKSEDGGYWCKCRPGYTGINCTILQEGPLQVADSAVSPAVFVGVVAGFALVVGVLVLMMVCIIAMLRKQKEKNKVLESASRSNSPMIKKRSQQRCEETPSSTDTASHDYWSIAASLNRLHPPIAHGQSNLYTQVAKRGAPPDLSKYSKAKSYDELSRESKVLTV